MSDARTSQRRLAREIALQWLYQWEIGGHHLDRMFENDALIDLHPEDEDRDALLPQVEALAAHDPEVYFGVTLLWKIIASWTYGLEEY